MKEELKKSLTDLIDETLLELEELKKSRFSASEIKLEGPGDGIAGKPSNGDLRAKKAEDEDEEDEEAEEEAEKSEDEEDEEAEEEAEKSDCMDKKEEDDPADHPEVKRKLKDLLGKKEDKDEPHKDDPKHEEKEKKIAKKLLDMHKSQEELQGLMKSLVEERIKPLEDTLSSILDMVNKIAEQPVPPKGTTSNAVPLHKSADDSGELLSKSDVASKLFELKKSGTKVDSLDITRAEMGQDLQKIVAKYKIS